MSQNYNVYEYITINVKNGLKPMYLDIYKNFGWIYINDEKRDYYINVNTNPNLVELNFKRDIDIKNKDKLQELQKKCEKAFLTVVKLEKMPQTLATIYSLIIGIIVMFFISVSVLFILKRILFLGIICLIIGLIASVFPFFIFKNKKNEKEIENKEKIKEQQKIISETCNQARQILLEN